MPLCAYFVNGNCRFGSKCVNDHIDLKTLLKNEAEAVLNGKQWLLSCFGPFKESAVIPNFIPDQSFEEVRIGFIENSKNGNVQNYINNLMSEYNNALLKMNELKMASNDTLQIVASIYNTSSSSDQKGKPLQQSVPNPFQNTSNIFGGNTQQTASIFGASSTTSNPFQQQAPTQQQTTSIFGSSTNNTQQQNPFSFSQASQAQPKPSVFAQPSIFNSSQPQTQTNTSVFGGQSNIFAQQANAFQMSAPTPVQQPAQSVFGSSASNQQNIFGSFSQNQSSIFSSSQPQQQQQPQNIFQAAQLPQNNASMTTNIFGAQQVPTQPTVEQHISPFQVQQNFQQPQVQQQMPASGQTSQIFGGNPFQQPVTMSDDHFYSKMEELPAEYIQAFQAESFIPGKIPILPPSRDFSYNY